jgi:hypothetical protein
LPGVYRFGNDKPTDPNLEPQRLTLYLPGTILDRAEMQAVRLGYTDSQEYCTDLLAKAVEEEYVREHMADVESKRGPLEGFQEITDDAEYLVDLREAATARKHDPPKVAEPRAEGSESIHRDAHETVEISYIETPESRPDGSTPARISASPPVAFDPSEVVDGGMAAEVIMRHAAQAGDDPHAFLPSLRRGESVPPSGVAELAQALAELERLCRGKPYMNRALTFALHRLAFESQILQTDAWPGAFDVWTVDMVRAVQEAVERILSGQDIRYYGPEPEPGFPSLPEAPR